MTDPSRSPRRIPFGLAISVLAASLGTSAANVALPGISADLGAPLPQTQWVTLAYLLSMTATSLASGHLGDLYGRRRMLMAGAAVFTLGAVVAALAPVLGALVAARAIQGAGAAVMMTLPLAIARDTVAADRLGATMGLLGTTAAVGTASGPAVGGALMALSGWPAVFLAMAPLGAVAIALSQPAHDGPRTRVRTRGAYAAGILLLTAGIALYALGVTSPGTSEGAPSWLLLACAAAALAVFAVHERRAAHPILPLSLLRARGVPRGAVLNLAVGTVMMSTLVIGPFYLAGALGLTPAAIGIAMAAGPVVSVLTGVPAGRLVDRMSAGRMSTAGLTTMVAGSLALALLPAWWGLAGYLAGTVLLAPGYQLFLAANNTGVLAEAPPERRGAVSGLLGLSRNLGLVTGASLMPVLFATASGSTLSASAPPGALDTALRTTFLTTAALLLAAAVLAALGARQPSAARTGPAEP